MSRLNLQPSQIFWDLRLIELDSLSCRETILIEMASKVKNTLSLKNSDTNKWFPHAIDELNHFLECTICKENGCDHTFALRKNITYNLQYMQFLNRCYLDLELTSAVAKMIIQNIVMAGSRIVESALYFLLLSNHRIDTEEQKALSLQELARLASDYKIIGVNEIDEDISKLCRIVDYIREHETYRSQETNYNWIAKDKMILVNKIVKSILSGELFNPTGKELDYFDDFVLTMSRP